MRREDDNGKVMIRAIGVEVEGHRRRGRPVATRKRR